MAMVYTAPLAGLTVIGLEQAVAAPYCTSRFADAGARVIKIERPEGDFARGYDDVAAGQSSYFVWLNRGKESVTLDLGRTECRYRLREMIASADVLVQNLKPGALDRLGLPLGELRRCTPRLVTCSITGYGETGPFATRKAYDLLVQAESGLCSITGGPGEPSRVGISVVDIATGAVAYAAVLEALIGRAVSGVGADISVSMFDVIAEWLTVPLLNHEGGNTPRRLGMAHPSIAPYGVFRTRDQRDVLISIQSDREWDNLARELLEAPGLARDPRFATNVARVQNRPETDGMVAAAFTLLDAADVQARLTRADIAFASVNDMAGLAAHPHLRRITVETPSGTVALPAPAPVIAGAPRTYGPVPALGAIEPKADG
jgi:formyl-CoA transferase